MPKVPRSHDHPDDVRARRRLMATLRAVARYRRLTQAEIARRAGTQQSAVSELFSGKVDPLLGTIQRLIRAVEVGYANVVESVYGTIRIEEHQDGGHWIWSPDFSSTSWNGRTITQVNISGAGIYDPSASEVDTMLDIQQRASDSHRPHRMVVEPPRLGKATAAIRSHVSQLELIYALRQASLEGTQ